MNAVEQLTSLTLLITFLLGISFGVVGGAVFGAKRGARLVPVADDARSAGARVIYGLWTRDDNGNRPGRLPGSRQVADQPRGDDGSGSPGQAVDR